MDDLRTRFRSLDRVQAPDLWREVVARADEMERTRRGGLSLMTAFFVAALLLALLAGAIAVGAYLQRRVTDWSSMTFANGVLVGHDFCGTLTAVTEGGERIELAVLDSICDADLAMDADMAWSSDGRRLAYLALPSCESCDPPTSDVFTDAGPWILDARTGVTRHLEACPDAFCHGIDISPDGSLVSYVTWSAERTNYALVVTAVDGSASRRIPLPSEPEQTVFSPDGTRLAFALRSGQSGIYVLDVSRVREAPLPEPIRILPWVEAYNLAWSPDGAWIAFCGPISVPQPPSTTLSGDRDAITLVRPDGTDAHQLVVGAERRGPIQPSWSADSQSIAYLMTPLDTERRGERLELWRIGIDGGQPRKLYESACCLGISEYPVWSPDGTTIALSLQLGGEGSPQGVFFISADTGMVRQVSDQPFAEPVWQPIPATPPDT
jgi:Tol biopolymer transport system component